MIKTKINHLETALRLSEERFKQMVDAIQDYAIVMVDADGRVATWNTGAERIKGYSADQIIGKPYDLFFPPEEAAAGTPERLLAKARAEGQAREKGWRVRKNGTRFFADELVSAVFDHDGRLQGYTKVTRDITQSIAFEELRETQERTHIILENINDGLEVFDECGVLVFCNDIAANMAGGPVEAHIGRTVLDISERMGLKENAGGGFPNGRCAVPWRESP